MARTSVSPLTEFHHELALAKCEVKVRRSSLTTTGTNTLASPAGVEMMSRPAPASRTICHASSLSTACLGGMYTYPLFHEVVTRHSRATVHQNASVHGRTRREAVTRHSKGSRPSPTPFRDP